MIGPVKFARGVKIAKRIRRFRRAMIAAGEGSSVNGKTDAEILDELMRMVVDAELERQRAEVRSARPVSGREIHDATLKLLDSATFAAESRAAGAS